MFCDSKKFTIIEANTTTSNKRSLNKSRNMSVQSKDNSSTSVESYLSNRKAKSKSNSFNQSLTYKGEFLLHKLNGKGMQSNKEIETETETNTKTPLINKLSLTPQLHNKKQEEIFINNIHSIIIDSKDNWNWHQRYYKHKLHRQSQGQSQIHNNKTRDTSNYQNKIHNRLSYNDTRSAFISKLIQCELWLPFTPRPYYNSLIIFDWDDTLFPTTNLLNRKDFNEDLSGNESLNRKVKNLQMNVLSILTSSINRSHTFIITNAVPGWVESNTKRFFPSVIPLLSQIKIISAREEFERYHPCNPRMWKIKSFLNILRYFDCHRVTNILCIGDSEYEMDAGKRMASYFKHVCIKRIRFKNAPSFHEVTNQIYSVITQFSFIYSSVKSGVYQANIKDKVKKQHSRKSSRKSFH